MYEQFAAIMHKLGPVAAYLFLKAAMKSLSLEDVDLARLSTRNTSIASIVAGVNIDDPEKMVCGIKMAYNQPELVCDDVVRFASVDMGWDVETTMRQFGFIPAEV